MKDIWQKRKTILLLAAMAVGAADVYYKQNKQLMVNRLSLNVSSRIPLRIVHLSDLHGAQFGRQNCRLQQIIAEQNADLIFFTGDLLKDNGRHLQECVDFLALLAQKTPLYWTAGNHDHCCGRFWELVRKLKQNNIQVLLNEMVSLTMKGQKIHLLGIDDKQYSRGAYRAMKRGCNVYQDYRQALSLLTQQEGIKLVLSHHPENFALAGDKSYNQYAFDVMFAGHAHGGQFRLKPFGGLYAPGQGILPQYTAGVYGSGPYLVVNRGLGNSTFPFRFNNPPEIVVVDLLS